MLESQCENKGKQCYAIIQSQSVGAAARGKRKCAKDHPWARMGHREMPHKTDSATPDVEPLSTLPGWSYIKYSIHNLNQKGRPSGGYVLPSLRESNLECSPLHQQDRPKPLRNVQAITTNSTSKPEGKRGLKRISILSFSLVWLQNVVGAFRRYLLALCH